jgi:hypothetical protein
MAESCRDLLESIMKFSGARQLPPGAMGLFSSER